MYMLVTQRFATYYELCYKYTIEEVLDLYEICMVSLYNKSILTENAMAKGK